MRSCRSVAIIGAGPSGLAGARRLDEAGLRVTVFERRSNLGGLWFLEHFTSSNVRDAFCASNTYQTDEVVPRDEVAPPSAGYQALTTNLITPIMTFDGFAFPEDTPIFLPRQIIFRYLQDFATHFRIEQYCQCNSLVRTIAKTSSDTWKVEVDRLVTATEPNAVYLKREKTEFDAVVVCNGHYDRPEIPVIPGLAAWMKEHPKKIIHSRHYKSNEAFADKIVLIVGSGVSGFDIGKDVALVAKCVYQAVRRRPHDTRAKDEIAIEQFVWSIIPPNMHKVSEVSALSDPASGHMTAILADGITIPDIDYAILCTGYLYSIPFLASPPIGVTGADTDLSGSDLTLLTKDGKQIQNLHMDTFYIPDPTLAFIGVPHNITTFQMFDLQAMMVAAVFSGRTNLPPQSEMRSEMHKRRAVNLSGKEFHSIGFENELKYIERVKTIVGTAEVTRLAGNYRELVKFIVKEGMEICRLRLLHTTHFKGWTKEDVEMMVEARLTELREELKKTQTEKRLRELD